MKKLLIIALAAFVGYCNISCAQNNRSDKNNSNNMKDKKILVAFFSRADENYNVGYIKVGNTQKIAEAIARETGADTFHIETVKPYPAAYNPCIEQAKEELRTNARPEIKGDIKVEDYDVVFIGFPNWWGEPPMALYTFIEKHNWEGKTIIPFITHEGSGFGGTDRQVAAACKGATMLKGLAVQGKAAQQGADATVKEWLKGLGY
ncbi:flavodoxin [Prevotella falsenii]|uniref:flavodoxin n=1 Tax=Prevotella falsenii TaxID=515414 RepID=UPI0004694CD3|nr:flavodoxin [Prevotella falsenii]